MKNRRERTNLAAIAQQVLPTISTNCRRKMLRWWHRRELVCHRNSSQSIQWTQSIGSLIELILRREVLQCLFTSKPICWRSSRSPRQLMVTPSWRDSSININWTLTIRKIRWSVALPTQDSHSTRRISRRCVISRLSTLKLETYSTMVTVTTDWPSTQTKCSRFRERSKRLSF